MLDKGLKSRGEVSEKIRFLNEDNIDFDLTKFLNFELQRGSEDSAEMENLGFTIQSAGLEGDLLKFTIVFDQPIQVSIGSTKDMMVTTIIDGSFFSS